MLRTVTFHSTSEDPTSNGDRTSRTITWQVTDADSDNCGAATSTAVTSTIILTPLADKPVVGGLAALSYTENNASGVLLAGNLTLADADDTQLARATVSISANLLTGDQLLFTNQNNITGSYDSNTGVLTLSGTASVAHYLTALKSVLFASTSDDPTDNTNKTTRTISWQVTDANSDSAGAAASDAVTHTITQAVEFGTQGFAVPRVAVFQRGHEQTVGGIDGDTDVYCAMTTQGAFFGVKHIRITTAHCLRLNLIR